MIRNGNVELQAREEEIRFIKMALNEEKRKQELLWKQLPNKRSLEEELVTLQIQLQQCQDRMLELEKHLEDPYDESRVRYLEGKDLPPAQLQDKVEDVSTIWIMHKYVLLIQENFFANISLQKAISCQLYVDLFKKSKLRRIHFNMLSKY